MNAETLASPILIREGREGDLDEIARLLALAFGQHRAKFAAQPGDAFERYLREVVDVRARGGEAKVFVAVDEERVVGVGALYPPGQSAAYARAVRGKPWPETWASLRLLAVHPAHGRRGLGRMLVEARVKHARELGAAAVALHTSREFEAAHRLVRRMGWNRAPAYDHAPAPGVWAEAYVLALV